MAEIKEIERKSSKIKFKVLLPEEEVKNAYMRTLNSLAKKVKVPGFRKGKAPLNILKRHVGEESLKSEVIDDIFPEVYKKAKEELDFIPVDYPKIIDLDFEEGKNSFLEVEVDIEPEIELPDLEKIEVKKLKIDVSENEVEDAITELRNSFATLEPKEDGEIKGEKDEVVFIKLDIEINEDELKEKYKDLFHKEEVPVYFESEDLQGLDKEITDRIKGKKVGDEVEFLYTFPQDFYIDDLKGKEVNVKIKINDVKKRVIPQADDELAKELGYETFEELRKDVYDRLFKEKQEREDIRFENKIIEKLIELTEFSPPESYVERRMETLKKDLIEDLKKQNITLSEYLNRNNLKEEDFDEYYRKEATTQLKISMILDKIEEDYKIKLEEEDLKKEIKKFAESYRIDEAKAQELYEKDEEIKSYIEYRARRNKVMELLKDKVKTVEVDSLTEKKEGENKESEETDENK